MEHLRKKIRTQKMSDLEYIKRELTSLVNSVCKMKTEKYPKKVELRTGTSDYLVFEQVFSLGAYNMELDFTPNIIIDCGANIGLSSIYFANIYPNANIIAIEPEKSNFDMLVRNTYRYPNIICLQKGIWFKPCFLEIIDSTVLNWAFMVKESNKKTNMEAVSILNLIEKYELPQIDILKIDIEGSEKELFENEPELWLPYVKILVIELHDRLKKGCSQALFTALTPYRYNMRVEGDILFIYLNQDDIE